MRTRYFAALLIVTAAFSVGGYENHQIVEAQAITSTTPLSLQVSGTFANCPAVVSGSTQFCFTTTGIYQSLSGAAWTLAGGATAVTLTLNGTTKTLPASFHRDRCGTDGIERLNRNFNGATASNQRKLGLKCIT